MDDFHKWISNMNWFKSNKTKRCIKRGIQSMKVKQILQWERDGFIFF